MHLVLALFASMNLTTPGWLVSKSFIIKASTTKSTGVSKNTKVQHI